MPKRLEFHDDFACLITNSIPFLVVANVILPFQQKVNVIFNSFHACTAMDVRILVQVENRRKIVTNPTGDLQDLRERVFTEFDGILLPQSKLILI